MHRFANQQCSATAGTERSLLREVILTHVYELQEEPEDPFKVASPDLREAFRCHLAVPFLSHELFVSTDAERIHTDDIVTLSNPAAIAKVLFHLRYGNQRLSLVSCFEKTGLNKFRAGSQDIFVETGCIRGACVYKPLQGAEILVAPQSFYEHAREKT